MRPISKGAAPAEFNVDVTSDANVNNSLQNLPAWEFTQQAVATVFGGQPPVKVSPAEVLRALLALAGGVQPPPPPAQIATIRRAKKPLNDRVSSAYKPAAVELGTRLGKFCCYCDQALPGQIAVEHVLPKAQYPLFSIAWENLLLACEICNSNKGSTPNRTEMNGWPPIPNVGPPFLAPNAEVNRYRAMRTNFLWPDTSQGALQDLRPRLEFQTQTNPDTWVEVSSPVHAQNAITNATLANRTVTASVWMDPPYQVPAGLRNGRVRVALVGTQQGVNSRTLLGLQKMGTEQGAGKISDTRMFYRTIAWFRMLVMFRPVAVALQPNNQALFPFVWPQVTATAPSVGFFPVWVEVLDKLGGRVTTVPGTATTLMNQFLKDTSNPLGFPGTDAARV